jgi:RING finger/CHY zinc finger protein 1
VHGVLDRAALFGPLHFARLQVCKFLILFFFAIFCSRSCQAPNFSKTCCFKCRLLTHQQTVHCDQCGVCRVGKPGDFQHCARCDVCVRRESFVGHPCVPGAHRGNCPICCETMRVGQSADAVVVSLCGHPMHDKCLARYVEYDNYKCPLCSRLLGDMSKQFAELHDQVLAQPMPPTYSLARSRVRCICCSAVSVVPFHFLGHECLKCGSFNTQVLATDGLPEIRSALPAEVMDVEAMDISE